MKRTVIYILCISIGLLFGFSGCKEKANNKKQPTESSCSDHDHDHDHDTHSREHTDSDGTHNHEHDHDHAGHDSSSCNSHNHDEFGEEIHSADDGHNHGAEETDHSNEIAFSKRQAQAIGLTTERVKTGTFSQVIKTSGKIESSQGDEQTIVATASGVVSFANANLNDGSAVKAGETLMTISAKELQEGDPLLKSKLEFEAAEKEYQRAENLVADKIISAKEFEQIRLRYETAKASYQGQAGKVSAQGIRITAPIGGYIKSRLVNQGDYVAIGQPIAIITKNKRLQLRAEVPEGKYKALKQVTSANFKPAYDNVTYKLKDLNGKLLSYGKSSNDNSYYIPITFEFDNVGDILPGAYTEVYLLSTPKEHVITVPMSALVENQGIYYVYLQIEPEAYKQQEVTVGENDGERVEILAGIKPGDNVVTKGAYQVKIASASGEVPHGHAH